MAAQQQRKVGACRHQAQQRRRSSPRAFSTCPTCPGSRPSFRHRDQGALLRRRAASPRRCSSWRRAPSCRCTSTPRWSRPTCSKARSRTTRACAGRASSCWRPAGNQHEAVAPNGALILGFFLKPNRFAYGEKFFTEAGER